jgi:hypothetical protein
MATPPKDHAASVRKLAAEARAVARNMADYGARQTMMQVAGAWDLRAERLEKHSPKSNGFSKQEHRLKAVRPPPAKRANLLRLWFDVRSLAKLIQPQERL